MARALLETETETPVVAGPWVQAAPFRAHLRHLMTAGQMSSSTVAILAGISPRCAYRLLHGRGGRPLKRISPESARKLLLVTTAEARAVRVRPVPAHTTVQHLGWLRAAGWSDGDLAVMLGVGQGTVASLISEGHGSCTQLMALRAAAEVSHLMAPLPDQHSPSRAA